MLAYQWVLVPETMAEEQTILSAMDFLKVTYADMVEDIDTKARNNLMSCSAKSWTTYGKITHDAAVPESCECFVIRILSSRYQTHGKRAHITFKRWRYPKFYSYF